MSKLLLLALVLTSTLTVSCGSDKGNAETPPAGSAVIPAPVIK